MHAIQPTDVLSELDKRPTHTTNGTDTINNRPDIGQVLDCALDPCIQDTQVTSVRLYLELSSPLVGNDDDNVPRRRSRSVILELHW